MAHDQSLPCQSRHADYRTRHLCEEFFETGGIEAVDAEDLPIRQCSPPPSRRPGRTSPACARPARSMPDRRRPRGPFKPPGQGISIWQAGPASGKTVLRGAGVGDFIFAGGDALAMQQRAWQRME